MAAFVRQSGMIRMTYSENPIGRDGRANIKAMSMRRRVSAAAAAHRQRDWAFSTLMNACRAAGIWRRLG
jgi:hypothetical protein